MARGAGMSVMNRFDNREAGSDMGYDSRRCGALYAHPETLAATCMQICYVGT